MKLVHPKGHHTLRSVLNILLLICNPFLATDAKTNAFSSKPLRELVTKKLLVLNKFFVLSVNTKVDVRFDVQGASWLPEDVKEKLLKQVGC